VIPVAAPRCARGGVRPEIYAGASDSPLPPQADVCTPQEAMARLKIPDRQRKTQVMVMFRRVKDSQRRH
jgi:hypothetical protein